MNTLATKVLDLSDPEPSLFTGTFEEYRRKKRRQAQREESQAKVESRKVQAAPVPVPATEAVKADKAKRTPWKLEALERKIFTLEETLTRLTEKLGDPCLYTSPDEQQRLSREYQQVKDQCDELTALWEEMA